MSGQRGWRIWWAKRRWYERNRRRSRRWRIDRHAARGGFFIRYPIEGEVLEALDDGRLTIGEGTLLEPGCWLTLGPQARIEIGANCWFGVNCAVTSGVKIGERCVVGSNSVVNRDLPPRTIAAGVPARPIREIDFA